MTREHPPQKIMSEETPTVKITDRRLFNADGSPREGVERAPQPPVEPVGVAAPRSPQSASAAPQQPAAAAASASTRAAEPAANRSSAAPAEPSADAATDPYFVEMMMFVAENAAAMLSGHPQFGGEVNLPYAKQFIDMLGALRVKTSGRLSLEEQNTLDTLLSQLRMQYVAQTNPRPAAGAPARGGFSGGDITGGR